MKKLILSVMAICVFGFANAQKGKGKTTSKPSYSSKSNSQTSQGKWLIEANTGFGGDGSQGSTQFSLTSIDGVTDYNLGAEAGYFFMDNLAVKVGVGYHGASGNGGSTSDFAYKIGAKYYIAEMIPVELSYTGVSKDGVSKNPSFVGIQAGYAWFLGENVSIEPGLRYNNSLDTDIAKSFLQLNIGFALHF
jgi:outer membrane protein W